MAITTRTGKVWLLKDIPFDKEYNHTMYFANATTQNSWICHIDHVIGSSNPKENQNQIKDPLHGTIRLQAHQENYLGCCYICFKNTSIDGTLPATHTYNYAFVDDCRFVSNEVLEIDYTIDVFQTYLFQGGCSVTNDMSKKPKAIKQYIKRTHTQTDVIGEHIEPEPFSSDRYVYKNGSVMNFFAGDVTGWDLLMYASKARSEGNNIKSMGVRCGLPQGLYCNVFSASENDTAFDKFKDWMDGLSDESYADWVSKIVALVAVPSEFVTSSEGGLTDNSDWHDDVTIAKNITDLDGYKPKNKKLLTFPYNGHLISNGDGSAMEYAYEFFSGKSMKFRMVFAIQPQPECIAAPFGYKGFPSARPNYDFKVTMKDFPMVPWVSDAYKQYLGTQGLSNAYGLISAGIKGAIGGSLLGNGLAGATLSMLDTGMKQHISAEQVRMGADGVHIASNSAMLADGQKTFYDCQKCICEEDAERFDHYLSRFGYSLNKVESIQFTNPRFNQHYVQTSECVVYGGAPASVKDTIANAFNKGITFWENTIGDYTL